MSRRRQPLSDRQTLMGAGFSEAELDDPAALRGALVRLAKWAGHLEVQRNAAVALVTRLGGVLAPAMRAVAGERERADEAVALLVRVHRRLAPADARTKSVKQLEHELAAAKAMERVEARLRERGNRPTGER